MELPDHVKRAVEEIAAEEKIVQYKMKVEDACKENEACVGILKRVILTGERDGKPITLRLICKLAPLSEARRKQCQVRKSFEQEFRMYEILSEFAKIQEKLPKESRFRVLKCFKINREEFKELLILEDLKEEDLVMRDRTKLLDYEHAKVIFNQLAKFHGTSFALRDQKPEIFQTFTDIVDVVFGDEKVLEEQASNFHLYVVKAMDTLSDDIKEEAEAKEIVRKLEEDYIPEMFKMVSGKLAEPYSVICHGDCWTNNMLFYYKDNEPKNMVLLDYQESRYASPATDTSYIMFCNTDKEFRDKYYKELMDYYHKCISEHIRALGSDPEKLFPYNAFQTQIKQFSKYALGMALYCCIGIFESPEDAKDAEDKANAFDKGDDMQLEDFVVLTPENDARYKVHMSDVILDCIRLGYA